MKPARVRSWTVVAVTVLAACVRHGAAESTSLQDRIAHELLEASPPADPTDARARDEAGEKLSRLQDLLSAAGERILWGGFDLQRGYEPKANPLTEFSPLVWAKLYLSTFTFARPYEVRQEGRFTVLEIGARFRDGLDAGDYPYPFWHSPQKWQAYVDTQALLLVFERDRLVAAYRRRTPDTGHAVARPWDSRWHWTDARGGEQPRVALFSYLLSADNPWLPTLDRTYRSLESEFRRNSCMSCHAPDNPAKANPLLLLDFPNQALVARHALVETLRRNEMPPADPPKGHGAGLASNAERQQLLDLATQFEQQADAALGFEQARSTATNGPHP